MEAPSPISRLRGTVSEFDRIRRCGTIEAENGLRAFVRYSAIAGNGMRMLRSGDQVSFDLEYSHRGPNAVHVTLDPRYS